MDIIQELYQQNYERLFRMAYIITRDRGAAEDAIHNGFVKAIIKLGKVRNPDKLNSWIFTIVRNEALLLLKKNKRVVLVDDGEETLPSTPVFDIPEEWVISSENRRLVMKALELMSPSLKEVVYLRYYIGLNFREISDFLGENQSTIRMRHMRAKEFIYRSLLCWTQNFR